jgi:hypothetical protein
MRISPALLFVAVLGSNFAPTASAQQGAPLEMRMAARLDLATAKNNLRYYWQVEYPRQLRALDQAIAMTRTDIENNKRLMRQYRPFTRFTIGQPFPITISHLESCNQAAEFRLTDLIAERDALVRFHSDTFNQLAFQVRQARLQVLALEPPMPEESTLPPQQP